jgi:hypothetical protein
MAKYSVRSMSEIDKILCYLEIDLDNILWRTWEQREDFIIIGLKDLGYLESKYNYGLDDSGDDNLYVHTKDFKSILLLQREDLNG